MYKEPAPEANRYCHKPKTPGCSGKRNICTMTHNPHTGSDFDDFLREEGLYEECSAIALIIHTIAEAYLPEYQKVKPNWRSVVFNRLLFLDNLPIFIFVAIVGLVGWHWPIVGGILPAICFTHPLFDHLGLSLKAKKWRPGSYTGLFLLFPLSILVYGLGFSHRLIQSYELLISGAIGLAISIWLLWMVGQEAKDNNYGKPE